MTHDTARRAQRGWYVYDWASSAFSTTVVTVFLGPYLTSIAENAAGADGRVGLFFLDVRPGSYFAYVVSLSVLIQVVVLPVVGAVADRLQRKLFMLGLFAYVGALATMAMYFVQGSAYAWGALLLVVANVSFGAAIVVYNAFLPEISTPDERDSVSSRGWALGYLGGAILLALNLVLFSSVDSVGITEGEAARISIASAGLWWGVFTLVPLRRLRRRPYPSAVPPDVSENTLLAGFAQLLRTLRRMRGLPQTVLFLVAYLFYNDGVQTVIALASIFGAEELKMSEQVLIVAVLLVQIVAFAGALLLGRMAGRFGARRVIAGSLVVWMLVVVFAYVLPAGQTIAFLVLAALIGVVLGGTQALSRSLFSQLIPRESEAEYFSFYEISERGTSWLGTLAFGLVFDLTGSYRNAIGVLVVFFVVGLGLLVLVRVRPAIEAAGNPQPLVV
ncbi:MAG: MFS transporter [Actinomycetes bacterium]